MSQTLGSEEMLVAFRFLGVLDGPELLEVLLEAIDCIGMEPDGGPDIRHYPNGHGKGGHGWQVYQPLTESWIIGGTWPDLDPPITRIVLSSCKPFEPGVVLSLLEKKVGDYATGYGGKLNL